MSTKSYVLVTNLPPTFKGNGFFYNLLKPQVSGGLLGAMMEDESSVGLAIFDTVQSALAACKERIAFRGKKDADGTATMYEATLRIVETENQARAVEEVYEDTIHVEGVPIKKDLIDFTYGYQLALRGAQGSKWCSHTENKESCPLSVKCKFLHLKEYQTGKKRLRASAADTVSSVAEERNIPLATLKGLPFVPTQLVSIPISPKTATAILAGDGETIKHLANELYGNLTAAQAKERAAAFLRLESPMVGTTDLDMFTSTPDGIQFMKEKAKCVLPPNNAPTPPEKDAFIRELIKRRNIASALMAKAHVDAIGTSTASTAHVNRLNQFFSSSAIQHQLENTANVAVHITICPRYDISSVLQEMTYFMKDNVVMCITQHYDDVLAPANLFEDSGLLAEQYNFINEKAQTVRISLEQWAATQPTSISAAFHVVFPSKLLNPTNFPTDVAPSPSSLLHVPEIVPAEEFGSATPVILGARVYDAATARSSLFSGTARDDAKTTTRPLWRRLKTSPTPMFERSTIDKFANW